MNIIKLSKTLQPHGASEKKVFNQVIKILQGNTFWKIHYKIGPSFENYVRQIQRQISIQLEKDFRKGL